LSARSHSRWDKVKQSDRWGSGPTEDPLLDTVFYTPSVVNAPNTIQADIRHCRDTLRDLAKRPLRQEKEGELDAIRRRDNEHQAKLLLEYEWFSGPIPEPQPTYGQESRQPLPRMSAAHSVRGEAGAAGSDRVPACVPLPGVRPARPYRHSMPNIVDDLCQIILKVTPRSEHVVWFQPSSRRGRSGKANSIHNRSFVDNVGLTYSRFGGLFIPVAKLRWDAFSAGR
jgi:hypothetical protein